MAKCSKKTCWNWPSGHAGERLRRLSATTAMALWVLAAPSGAGAQTGSGTPATSAAAVPTEFKGADLALGERLIRELRCSECHVRRVGGDGSAIYRPQGRISRPSALLTMVEVCNTELKLQLFPEDVQAIAAVLQRDHYRFKPAP